MASLQTPHHHTTPRFFSYIPNTSFSRRTLGYRNLCFWYQRRFAPVSYFGGKGGDFCSCIRIRSVRCMFGNSDVVEKVTRKEEEEESGRPPFDINLAVVLAGFAFEAYTSPPENVGRREVDAAGCMTVYLSESFVREIYDGQLFVKLKKGIDLPAMDPWGTSDPYVVMQLDGQVVKSKVKWGKKEPTWNEDFTLNIKRHLSKNLQVAAWDANLVTPHKRMGNAVVNLESLCDGEVHDLVVELEGMGGGGKLQMEVKYKTFEEIEEEKKWWKIPFVSQLLQINGVESALNKVIGSESVPARQFVEYAFGQLKSFNDLSLLKDRLLSSNGSQVVESSETIVESDKVSENAGDSEPSVGEARPSENTSVESSQLDIEDGSDKEPAEQLTQNGDATQSDEHFWKSFADAINQKVMQKLGLTSSLDLKLKWEGYDLLNSIGQHSQKIADAGYVESGLATPEGQGSDSNKDSQPLSASTIQSSLPDIKKATEELVKQTDSVLGSLMVLTAAISKLNKETDDSDKSSSKSDKFSSPDGVVLDEKKEEEMRTLFSSAESAMEAWAMLATSLGQPSFVKSEFEKLCFLDNESTDTQVAIWRDSTRKRLVVAFRGTEQSKWKDLRTDLMLAPAGLNPERIGGDFKQEVQVHSGFLQAYDSVRIRIISTIKQAIGYPDDGSSPPSKWHVYVTGHSLGGALATLLALEVSSSQLAKSGAISVTMYNFGSPRVGNKRFAEVYNAKVKDSWRVVNHRDIIPNVPRLMGYAHVAQPVYLAAGELQDALENLEPLKDGYQGDIIGEYTPDILVNEFMKGEKELIEKILQTEINIFRAIRDGSALMQHMEDFYYITLLEKVRANYQTAAVVGSNKENNILSG